MARTFPYKYVDGRHRRCGSLPSRMAIILGLGLTTLTLGSIWTVSSTSSSDSGSGVGRGAHGLTCETPSFDVSACSPPIPGETRFESLSSRSSTNRSADPRDRLALLYSFLAKELERGQQHGVSLNRDEVEWEWPALLCRLKAIAANFPSEWRTLRDAVESYASTRDGCNDVIDLLPTRLLLKLPSLRSRFLTRLATDEGLRLRCMVDRIVSDDSPDVAGVIQAALPQMLECRAASVRDAALAYIIYEPRTLPLAVAQRFIVSQEDFRCAFPILVSARRRNDAHLAEWFTQYLERDPVLLADGMTLLQGLTTIKEWGSDDGLRLLDAAPHCGPDADLNLLCGHLEAWGPPDTREARDWLLACARVSRGDQAGVYLDFLQSLSSHRLTDSEVRPFLLSRDEPVRGVAAYHLGNIDELRRIATGDSAASVRVQALCRLGQLGCSGEAIPLLTRELVRNPPRQVREAVVHKLRRLVAKSELREILVSYAETTADEDGQRLVEYWLKSELKSRR